MISWIATNKKKRSCMASSVLVFLRVQEVYFFYQYGRFCIFLLTCILWICRIFPHKQNIYSTGILQPCQDVAFFSHTPNNIHPFKRFMKVSRSCEPLVVYHTNNLKKKSVEGSAIYFDLLSQSALIGPRSLRICMQAICPLDTILTKLRKHISPFLMV